MSRIVHMCQSVRGALRNFHEADWVNVMRNSETGEYLTPDEVREYFLDQLSMGHEVIPLSPDCEDFDYSGSGCPGHNEPVTTGQKD